MKKEILSEINRFREIIGLKLLNEALGTPGVIEGIEKVLERFGISGTKALDRASLEAIEKSISTDASALSKFEKIGEEVTQGATQSAENLVDNLVKDASATRILFDAILSKDKQIFQEIADGIVSKSAASNYSDFENLWNATKDHNRIVRTAEKYGLVSDENRIFWEKWEPNVKSSPIVGPTTSTLNAEAIAYFKLTPSQEKMFTEEEIKILNTAAKDAENKFTNLSKLEKVQAQNALEIFGKKLEDALTAIEKTTDPIVQRKIKWWKSFWEGSKKNITPGNLWAAIKIGATLFGGYIAYGLFTTICDKPILKTFCSAADKKLFDDSGKDKKDDETNPDETKPEEKKDDKKIIGYDVDGNPIYEK
jgi:hypothetical protein